MKIKKYEIYNHWKDKAITKNFEVKLWKACIAEDEAVKIIEFPDEIACWACGIPPYQTADSDKIEKLWNHDHLLDRAHIFARSKGGGDMPSNLFLLCPNCHAESPDTTNPKNFMPGYITGGSTKIGCKFTKGNWIKQPESEELS